MPAAATTADEPQVLHLTRRPVDFAAYKLRGALETDVSTLIKQSTIVYDDEQQMVTIVYLMLRDDARAIVRALRNIEISGSDRTNGMRSNSVIFGYSPRIALRHDYCTTTALARKQAREHAVVASYARRVARYYEQYNPALYARHQAMVEAVLPDWQLEESVFTSGIINRDNVLPYHHDSGNFRDVWSNMLGFKRAVRGGYLAVPEYDIALEIADNSLTMFDGQNLLHGVTPITKLKLPRFGGSVEFLVMERYSSRAPSPALQQARRQRRGRALVA